MAEENNYPAVGFNFEVKFNGGGISGEAGFQKVSGLKTKLGVQIVKPGCRLPKPAIHENLTLERGIISNSSLRKWIKKAVIDFEITPVTVTIHLLNDKQQPLITWILDNAWPVSWAVSDLHSQENKIATETIELAYERLEVTIS